MKEGTRAKLVKWAARGAFFASVLALLGTSRAKGWSVEATIEGPKTAPAGSALEIVVDSGGAKHRAPQLRAHDFPKTSYRDEVPCANASPTLAKMTCLLPPSATLDAVEIEGYCGGCSGNCPPPADAFVKATATAVPAWKDVATKSMTTKLPSHQPAMIGSRFFVKASGARFFTAKLSVVEKNVGILYNEEVSCNFEREGHAGCYFLVYDNLVKGRGDVEATVDVTGWGTDCKEGSTPCAPPGTLKVDSLEILQ
jgi:hypothetical protein